MKLSVIFFVASLALARGSVNIFNKRSLNIHLNGEQRSSYLPTDRITKGLLNNNWNVRIDHIIHRYLSPLEHNVALPDSELDINPEGKITITNISVTGFSSLHRAGDVTVVNYVGETKFIIPCSFKEIQFTGRYEASVENENSKGTLVGIIKNSSYVVNAFYSPPDKVIEGLFETKGMGNMRVAISDHKKDGTLQKLILSELREYSMTVSRKVSEIFATDVKYTISKVQEDIDKSRTTTVTPMTKNVL